MADDADHHRTTSDNPSLASVYDYYLDGSLNSAIDRHFAIALQETCPSLPRIVRHQRAFLGRAIQALFAFGVRQFVDLGSGLPAAGHVHHIVRSQDPNCAVIYVDNDPLVVAQGDIILDRQSHARIIHADARRPADIIHHRQIRELIDPHKPVGITMIGLFELVADHDDPAALVAAYREITDAQTYLALTMVTHNNDATRIGQFAHAAEIMAGIGATLTARPPADLTRWLATTSLVDPGIQPATLWSASQPPGPPEPDAELTLAALTRHQPRDAASTGSCD